MKRDYVKPVFVAECYSFSSSIAKCEIDIDTTDPIIIVMNETKLCPSGDGGHKYNSKGSIAKINDNKPSVVLFNDGISNSGCEYDWDGRTDVVAQTGENFAQSFFGNSAGQDNHAPAYKGEIFLS